MRKEIFGILLGLVVALPIVAVPLSCQTNIVYGAGESTIGYNITISYFGLIKNLEREGNQTTFTGVCGIIVCKSEKDDGGIWVGIGTLRGLFVSWLPTWTFTGVLRNHFICGKIEYKKE